MLLYYYINTTAAIYNTEGSSPFSFVSAKLYSVNSKRKQKPTMRILVTDMSIRQID